MDLKKIKALLEKFYNGESTLEEEKILREYFNSDNVAREFAADKDIFEYQTQEINGLEQIPDLSDEIWGKISGDKNHKTLKYRSINYVFLRIAAGIIIILGLFAILKDQNMLNYQKTQYTDTYQNPEQAYEQTKATLLYVSALLNKGTNHLEPINKLEEGTKELQKLKTFNEGLNELDPLKKYSVANKYFKNK